MTERGPLRLAVQRRGGPELAQAELGVSEAQRQERRLTLGRKSIDCTGVEVNPVTLTITSIVQHPQYVNCTACACACSMSDFGYRPDVALITVQELTPSVPQAVIDPNPAAIGTSVTLTGYGCENGVGQPSVGLVPTG